MKKSNTPSAMKTMIALSVVSIWSTGSPAKADMTASQIVDRCKSTYSSLKSYSGTTNVVSKSTIGGVNTTYNTTATVQFVRPGKIKVEIPRTDPDKYAFLSDGTKTWQTISSSPAKWVLAQSTEAAIFAYTGTSRRAATTIPAILTGAVWGDPFIGLKMGKVTQEIVNRHAVYRIVSEMPIHQTTFWVDQKMFLLVKSRQISDISKMLGQIPKDSKPSVKMPTSGITDITETFTDIQINKSVASSIFKRPAGAPK